MTIEISGAPESGDRTVKSCARLLRAYTDGTILRDEFFYNLAVTLIHAAIEDARCGTRLQEGWKPSLELLPPVLLREWIAWMEREVVAVDYMPSPNPFLPNTGDPTVIEAKRRELRPFYVALFDLACH